MKISLPLAFRITECLLKGRGKGMLEGYKSNHALTTKMNRKFIKLMRRTVGLEYTYPVLGTRETFTTLIKTNPKTVRAAPNPRKAKRFLDIIMQHIDEAYTSGELGNVDELPEFVISTAKIDDSMTEIKLYWEISGSAFDDNEKQKKLEELAPRLRTCLHSLNLGSIPPIVFIMDDSRHKLNLLDEKFDSIKKAINESKVYDEHTDSMMSRDDVYESKTDDASDSRSKST